MRRTLQGQSSPSKSRTWQYTIRVGHVWENFNNDKSNKTSRHPFIAFFKFQKYEWKTYYCEKQVKFEEAVLFLLFPCRLSCWLRFNIYSCDMSRPNDSILISSCRGSMIVSTCSPGGSPERVTGLHCNMWAVSQLNNAVLCNICCPSNLLWSC
jgi:hypothetical protein